MHTHILGHRLEFGLVKGRRLVGEHKARGRGAGRVDEVLDAGAVGEGVGPHEAAAKVNLERLAGGDDDGLALADLAPGAALTLDLDAQETLLHAEAVVDGGEGDPLLGKGRGAVDLRRLERGDGELAAALAGVDEGPREDAAEEPAGSRVGAQKVGLKGTAENVLRRLPLGHLGRLVAALKLHVEPVLGRHELGDQQALEVPVVRLGDDEALVLLADVAEEVDPVARRHQTQRLRVRAQQFWVVDYRLRGKVSKEFRRGMRTL